MTNKDQDNISYRDKLALIIITATFIAIIILSFLYYFCSEPKDEAPSKIFSTLIPLFATWIGTVLAFYFGRLHLVGLSIQQEGPKLVSLDKLAGVLLEFFDLKKPSNNIDHG